MKKKAVNAPIKFDKIVMFMTVLTGHVIGKYVSCVSNWTVRAIARALLNELKVRQGNEKSVFKLPAQLTICNYTCLRIKQIGLLTPAMQSSDFVLSFIRLQAELDVIEPYYARL